MACGDGRVAAGRTRVCVYVVRTGPRDRERGTFRRPHARGPDGGRHPAAGVGDLGIHRRIGARRFDRAFVLADLRIPRGTNFRRSHGLGVCRRCRRHRVYDRARDRGISNALAHRSHRAQAFARTCARARRERPRAQRLSRGNARVVCRNDRIERRARIARAILGSGNARARDRHARNAPTRTSRSQAAARHARARDVSRRLRLARVYLRDRCDERELLRAAESERIRFGRGDTLAARRRSVFGTATISGVAVDMQTGFPVTSIYAKIDGSPATIFGTTGLPSPALARLFNDPAVGSAGFAIRIPTQVLALDRTRSRSTSVTRAAAAR